MQVNLGRTRTDHQAARETAWTEGSRTVWPATSASSNRPRRLRYGAGRNWLWLLLCLWQCSICGCAHFYQLTEPWRVDSTTENGGSEKQVLSPPKLAPDTVVVHAVLIRFPEEQAASLNEVWRFVDETKISLPARRALFANGLQCGVLVGEMPQVIRARLKELNSSSPGNSMERLGLAAEVPSDTQRLHCHAGRRKELQLRPGLNEPITVLHVRDGNLQGNTYTNPRVLMDLRASPLGDGRAKLKLTPEIQHGEPIESVRVSPNKMAQYPEVRQQQQIWDYMAMEVTLSPGEFFLCTLTDPPRGLGQAMFSTRTSERTTERVLLVLQMVVNPLDELFAPEEVEAARLASEKL